MRRILLVEDYEEKANNIIAFLKIEFPDLEVERCTAYNSAQETIFENPNRFDLILLDMSMTTYDLSTDASGGYATAGERRRPAAGLHDLLSTNRQQLRRRDATTSGRVCISTLEDRAGLHPIPAGHS